MDDVKDDELLNDWGNADNSEGTVLKIKSPEEIRNEWLSARRGYFTASCAGQLMGFEDNDELPAGAKTYAKKVAIERMTQFNLERPSGFKSAAMQWGNDTERLALAAVFERTRDTFDCVLEEQKFFKLNDWVGGTPDGVRYRNLHEPDGVQWGIEIKCPNSDTHFDYLQLENQDELKIRCKYYYWQIQQLMLCTDAQAWWFVSFDPDFIDESKQLKILRVDRNNEDIEKLVKRLSMAINYAKSLTN